MNHDNSTSKGAADPIEKEAPHLIISPRTGLFSLDVRELLQYRDLFVMLVVRDISVRYKQTLLGVAWSVLQPLSAMLVFTLFFGKLAKMPSDGVPYPLFSYSALVLWTFFAQAMNGAANSLVANERLVTKVYFPRVILPASAGLSFLVDLIIASCLLLFLMPYYGWRPSPNIWALPIMVTLAAMCALGAGIWLAALNVKYRDFRYVIPFMTQLWMFASPVVYPVSLVPDKWKVLMSVNPMSGAIEGFRWALLGTPGNPWMLVGASAVFAGIILILGIGYFRRTEEFFADLI